MKCPSCGTKNKDGMKFCKICGAHLETSVNNKSGYNDGYISNFHSESQNNKKSKKGIVILVISIIVVMLAIGACVAFLILGNTSNGREDRDDKGAASSELGVSNNSAVSSGSDKSESASTAATIAPMPDFVNKNFTSCESQLNSLGIKVKVDYAFNDKVANGYIISQSITKGAEIKHGDTVTIVVSKGPDKCPYDYQQKLTVTADSGSSDATAVLYEWKNGDWKKTASYSAVVGSNGIGESREGSSTSPKGLFKLGVVLSSEKVSTNLSTYHVTGSTCVIDDMNSSYYNQIMEISEVPSGTHYDNIGKGFVNGSTYATIFIEHNGNGFSSNGVTEGKGSAIGLRGQNGSLSATYGDVDISSENMKDLLSKLDLNKKPMIELVSE